MIKDVELFITDTSWTPTGTVSVHGLNSDDSFIAGMQSNSLIFHFPSGNLNESITKTVSVDVTDYDELVFNLWSRNKRKSNYRQKADCNYKLTIASGKSFYIRTFDSFTHEVISLTGITNITEITIEALHNDDDYLIMSYMIASKDELPIDIFTGVKGLFENIRDEKMSNGISAGTITGSAGDATILLDGNYIDRYAVIDIGGDNPETHQLLDNGADGFTLSPLFDGDTLQNSHTDDPVYLKFPVGYGRQEMEILLPGIVMWSIAPEPIMRSTNFDIFLDTFTDTGIDEKKEGKILNFPLLIDIEARHYELIAKMSEIIRTAICRNSVWINGRKFDILLIDSPIEVEPIQAFEIIPKVQYTLNIEIKESVWTRQTLPLISQRPAVSVDTPIP